MLTREMPSEFSNHVSMLSIEKQMKLSGWKYGGNGRTDAEWLAILVEEVGELARDLRRHHHDYRTIEEDLASVGAVSVMWANDRRIFRDSQELG